MYFVEAYMHHGALNILSSDRIGYSSNGELINITFSKNGKIEDFDLTEIGKGHIENMYDFKMKSIKVLL